DAPRVEEGCRCSPGTDPEPGPGGRGWWGPRGPPPGMGARTDPRPTANHWETPLSTSNPDMSQTAGLAIACLVLGILTLISFWYVYSVLLPGSLAIVLGVMGLR